MWLKMSLTILVNTKWTLTFKWDDREPGDDALKPGIIDDTLHGVGFSTGCLTISKDSSIVAGQDICKQNARNPLYTPITIEHTFHYIFGSGVIHLALSHIGFQDLGIKRWHSHLLLLHCSPYLVEHIHFARNGDTLVIRARGELDNNFRPRSLLCVI